MANPATRENLKQYALRTLGKPVIDINVDDDQLEDRLDEALQFYAQYHYDGIRRTYLKYKLTADDKTRLKASTPNSESATESATSTTTTAITLLFHLLLLLLLIVLLAVVIGNTRFYSFDGIKV